VDTLRQDFLYAIRTMRKNRAFTLLVVLTLALGIGVNAVVFSMVASVLFGSLPGEKPQELIRLYSGDQQGAVGHDSIALPIYTEYRSDLKSITRLSAFRDVSLNFSQNNETAERTTGAIVSGDFFDALGLHPFYGRLFSGEDDGSRGNNPVVVLSERLWRREFDARPDVIGTSVKINGQHFTIVGVAPAALQQFDRAAQLWLPMSMASQADPMLATQIDRMTNPFFNVIGRLQPGVSLKQARQELAALETRLGSGQSIHFRESMTGETVVTTNAEPAEPATEEIDWQKPWMTLELAKKNVGTEEVRLSWLLVGVVALVLLIACADVAGLLLARAESSKREAGIRVALGASSWDLYRQHLVQGALFSICGALCGLLLAWWAQLLILAVAPSDLPLPMGFASPILAPRLILFVVLVSAFAAAAFTLVLAASESRIKPWEALKGHSSLFGNGSMRGIPVQTFLIIFQIACSVVLLIGAGLLIRTLHSIARVDLGFDAEHVLSASLDLSRQGYDKFHGAQLLDPLLATTNAIPGVQSVALRAGALIYNQRSGSVSPGPSFDCANLPLSMISPGYFKTLDIAFLKGRDFTVGDSKDTAGVVIVNRAAAQLCWPGSDALGQHFSRLKTLAKPFEVVGVVGNVGDQELQQRKPQIYVSLPQFYQAFPFQPALSILLRTTLPPHVLVSTLNSAVQGIDSNLSLYNVQTPREQLADAFSRERFLSQLLSAFGTLALVLAVAGLYGMLSYLMERRTHEFGVRMAIGAHPRDILGLVVVQGGQLTLAGIALGTGAAVVCTRYLQALLFRVTPTDVPTFVAVAILLFAVALFACYFPARRATRVDPSIALRHEQ
jgi:putative ABC transport system permease protein